MYLIPIAWIYVATLMAVAEATNDNGTLLGALITFVLYGLLPVLLALYLMGAPSRRKAHRAREEAAWRAAQQPPSGQPDAGGHAPAAAQSHAVAPVREEA
jgi:hypothetical protein